mmetsp:Transcript_22111/g.71380  ORF Transcript_22111/g.71380 Transcript_22111/m.71380 type:complete len:269 (+) Transcript_22111:724-1530(+)
MRRASRRSQRSARSGPAACGWSWARSRKTWPPCARASTQSWPRSPTPGWPTRRRGTRPNCSSSGGRKPGCGARWTTGGRPRSGRGKRLRARGGMRRPPAWTPSAARLARRSGRARRSRPTTSGWSGSTSARRRSSPSWSMPCSGSTAGGRRPSHRRPGWPGRRATRLASRSTRRPWPRPPRSIPGPTRPRSAHPRCGTGLLRPAPPRWSLRRSSGAPRPRWARWWPCCRRWRLPRRRRALSTTPPAARWLNTAPRRSTTRATCSCPSR